MVCFGAFERLSAFLELWLRDYVALIWSWYGFVKGNS